jgi:hypothetical protein
MKSHIHRFGSFRLYFAIAHSLRCGLVKNTPHAPGRLFVGVAPCKHIGEGSNVHSKTKIFNLDSDEFGSNPPFLKTTSCHSHFVQENGGKRMLEAF